MPFKITHRKEQDVPLPSKRGKVNQDLAQIRAELARLGSGMVLEIDAGSARAVRRTKGLVTRAANDLGVKFQHWHQGTKVFARPAVPTRERRRQKSTESR